MAEEDENPRTTVVSKPTSNLNKDNSLVITVNSQSSSSQSIKETSARKDLNDESTPLKNALTPKEIVVHVAAKIASQPLHFSDPDVWGVLTAISDNARKRCQGMHMLLTSNEHCIGRKVKDISFQIVSPAASANHCKIYRKRVVAGDGENSLNSVISVFLKDSSTNGTYLNWEKLNKSSSEAKLRHGDIISLAFTPQHESSVAFVFRTVLNLSSPGDGAFLKRKAEEHGFESKKLKGIGIGGSEGQISLDDFRSLQRSNKELRKMLEDHVVTIDLLRAENRAIIERHEIEMKDLKESISDGCLGQIKELQQVLEAKEKELMDSNRISSAQKLALEDLNKRLGATMQSCFEANEIISRQKASMSQLKALLYEEREQKREEREKAVADLKTSSIQRIPAEAQEEMQRLSDAAVRREKEQQEVINELQETKEEIRSLMETLRSKLEDTKEKLVSSENKVCQLEAQVCKEQLASATNGKRVDELEQDTKRLRKELEHEKAARAEVWAKVSALELEISAEMRYLGFEKRRLKCARERIMLRDTQLPTFYSTTEDVDVLLAKHREQLKAMQRTLEAEENNPNTSVDIGLNLPNGRIQGSLGREKEVNGHSCSAAKAGSSTSTQRHGQDHVKPSDEVSVTEKKDCNVEIQINDEDTQEVEFTGSQCSAKDGFGSDIDDVGTAPNSEGDPVGTQKNLDTDGMRTEPVLVGELAATERILETESPGHNCGGNIDLNRCNELGQDTIQVDDQTNREAKVLSHMISQGSSHNSQSSNPLQFQNPMLNSQAGSSIRTADLLASEVTGSWPYNAAPSVHGGNDFLNSEDNNDDDAAFIDFMAMVADSQNVPPSETIGGRWIGAHQALSEMIRIVAPNMEEQFSCAVGSNYKT